MRLIKRFAQDENEKNLNPENNKENEIVKTLEPPKDLIASSIGWDSFVVSWEKVDPEIKFNYEIYLDGNKVAEIMTLDDKERPEYRFYRLKELTDYIVTVATKDSDGNKSVQSEPLNVKTTINTSKQTEKLRKAIEGNDVEKAMEALDNGANVNYVSRAGNNDRYYSSIILERAILKGNPDMIAIIFGQEDCKYQNLDEVLYSLVSNSRFINMEGLQTLLDLGARADHIDNRRIIDSAYADSSNRTNLQWACENPNATPEMIKLLVDNVVQNNPAAINSRDDGGNTALALARKSEKSKDVIDYIIQNGGK